MLIININYFTLYSIWLFFITSINSYRRAANGSEMSLLTSQILKLKVTGEGMLLPSMQNNHAASMALLRRDVTIIQKALKKTKMTNVEYHNMAKVYNLPNNDIRNTKPFFFSKETLITINLNTITRSLETEVLP